MNETSPAGFEIGDGVLCQSVHDEIVLLKLNSTNQEYYALDSVGARIWQLLLEHPDIGAVADRICEDYDIDDTTAHSDVISLVRRLQSAGLLKVAAGSQNKGYCNFSEGLELVSVVVSIYGGMAVWTTRQCKITSGPMGLRLPGGSHTGLRNWSLSEMTWCRGTPVAVATAVSVAHPSLRFRSLRHGA